MNISAHPELIHFNNRQEVLDREKFDIGSSVSVENFVYIVGHFTFKEKERCQVLKKRENCNHTYFKGWVVSTTEGKEAMIGCDCADSKFHLSDRVMQEISRAKKLIERRELLERVQFYIENKKVMLSWLDVEVVRLADIERSFEEIKKCIPNSIQEQCINMQKTGRRVVTIKLKRVEIDDEGKEHVEWIDSHVGSLVGAHLWVPGFFNSYRKRLSASRGAIYEIKEAIDSKKDSKLNELLKTLDDFKRAISDISKISEDISKFCSLENMRSMYFMVKNNEFRANIARAYYLAINEIPTSKKCGELSEQIGKSITENIEGKEYKFAA